MWYTKTAIVLANIGAINWGLTELGYNVVDRLLGAVSWLPMVVYYVIGLCGLYGLYSLYSK